jgi:hypothetical protein
MPRVSGVLVAVKPSPNVGKGQSIEEQQNNSPYLGE